MAFYTREDGCRAWLTYGNLSYDGLLSLWVDSRSCAERIYYRFEREPSFILKYGNQQSVDALKKAAEPERMHRMMETMYDYSIRIMSVDDDCYPDLLRKISDPPVLLFYQGYPECLQGKCVTMVGARRASPHGIDAARRTARELALSGVTVVSGFALGIDTACHLGCLDAGGTTAAVMACGLDVEYPSGTDDLRKMIVESGGITLSEFPLGSPALSWHFHPRNRILSGLSMATIMMECQPKSGCMITVQHALDQGREVFAYPGYPGAESAKGAHALLREGATYFSLAEDILTDMKWNRVPPPPKKEEKAALPPLTDSQRKIMKALTEGEASFDQLAMDTGLDASELSSSLTMLQLLGLIRPMPGKTYVRV